MKEIVILGGPNGAGKTTAARVLLREFFRLRAFLNADEIAREISPTDVEGAAFAAGRRMIERMRELVRREASFGFETTCSGKSYLPLLQRSRADGWRITLIYLWLPRVEDAIERVSQRVRQGGHGIPVDTIIRRFHAGLSNMRQRYLPVADEAEIYDNLEVPRILIAGKREGHPLFIHDPVRWSRILEDAKCRR
jgi:predicted ABC-type ATPase